MKNTNMILTFVLLLIVSGVAVGYYGENGIIEDSGGLDATALDCNSDEYVKYFGSSFGCDSVSVTDQWVDVTGDTMTGPLSLIYADSAVTEPFINIGNTTLMGSGTMVKIEYSAGASASNRYGLWIDGNSSDTDNYILYLQGSTNIWNMNGAGTVNHINGNYNLSNVLYDSAGPVELGTAATTGHSLSTGDVIVGGALEVDGLVYFDGTVTANNVSATQFTIGNSASFIFGSPTTGSRILATATKDQFNFAVGSDHGNQFVFTTKGNIDKNFDFPTPTNPTLLVTSANDPDSFTDEWISFTHDQTNGVIDVGTGVLEIADSMHIEGSHEHYGEMNSSNNVTATTITTQNVWVDFDGFTDNGMLDGWSFNVSDPSLVYTHPTTIKHYARYTSSSQAATTNDVFQMCLFVNDNIEQKCLSERKYSTTDVGNSGGQCVIEIRQNDVVKLKVRNLTDTDNITLKHTNVVIHQL